MNYLTTKQKAFFKIIIGIIIFIFISYLVQANLDFFKSIIQNNILGILIYMILNIIAIVIAPVTVFVFLMPIASNLFGWFATAIITIIAWTIGSVIAFIIARKYGVPLVKKLIPLNKITKIEKRVPKENVFWSIVFLRMVIPVDILSYALGLFSKISLKRYTIATFIGITPFAFVFAYAGSLPIQYQIVALIIALISILIGLSVTNKK